MLLAAREEDLRKPLVTAAAEVRQVGVGLDSAGQNLEVADAAELVAAGAEYERLDRVVRLHLRRRHQLCDGRHQGAYAKELGGGAADHRRHLAVEDALAQAALDLVIVERPRVEVF